MLFFRWRGALKVMGKKMMVYKLVWCSRRIDVECGGVEAGVAIYYKKF